MFQLQYKNEANIIIKRAEDWSYKFQEDCKWDGQLLNEKFHEEIGLDEYKIIKYTRFNRRDIEVSFNEIF